MPGDVIGEGGHVLDDLLPRPRPPLGEQRGGQGFSRHPRDVQPGAAGFFQQVAVDRQADGALAGADVVQTGRYGFFTVSDPCTALPPRGGELWNHAPDGHASGLDGTFSGGDFPVTKPAA